MLLGEGHFHGNCPFLRGSNYKQLLDSREEILVGLLWKFSSHLFVQAGLKSLVWT